MEPLHIHEVHLWCARPETLAAQAAYAAARALLTADEAERLERFAFTRDRLIFLATRALVRRVLSRYAPVALEDWRFAITDRGRPEVQRDSGPPLRFNLSNTRGLVICGVVGEGEIGVDVELVRRAGAPLDLADHYFAPAEIAALRALPPPAQSTRFFEYWTLKESYLKARGVGLGLPLDRFAFSLDAGRPPRFEVDPALDDHGDAWRFSLCRPTADHVAALCVRPPQPRDVRVVLRWQRLG
jgi:4'-phosphopantetheinyl transferase